MSSEIFGKFRKFVAKCLSLKITFQHFWNFFEIFGNCRKSSEFFGKIGKCRKVLKTIVRHFLKIFENFRKSSEVFGNARKTLETPGKFSNVIGGLRKFFIPFQPLTPVDWRSDSRISICNLHWYYAFCTGITLFALVLHFLQWCYSLTALLSANQNRVIFFMYVIR